MKSIIRKFIPRSFVLRSKLIIIRLQNKDKNLRVGKKCIISNSNFGIYNTIYENCKIQLTSLGDFTYIGSGTSISRSRIGKYCSIGHNCTVGLGKHPSKTFVSTHPVFFSTRKQAQITFVDKDFFQETEKIEIGNDVWIGDNVLIADGVKIGNGSIIAAGSVVSQDVKDYAIVGGIPAKLIRFRFSEKEIKFLNSFKWWDKDISWLKDNVDLFQNIDLLKSKQTKD